MYHISPSLSDRFPDRGEGSDMIPKRSSTPSLSSLPEDAAPSKILRLLRVLSQLNTLEGERPIFSNERRSLPDSAFVNNKLSAKLTRQLEEPMIVARYGFLSFSRCKLSHFSLALVCRTGRWISLSTSPSSSPSPRDTASCNQPRSVTPV